MLPYDLQDLNKDSLEIYEWLRRIKESVQLFLRKYEQTTYAFSKMTRVFSRMLDVSWSQSDGIISKQTHIVEKFEELTKNLTHTLLQPIELQLKLYDQIRQSLRSWRYGTANISQRQSLIGSKEAFSNLLVETNPGQNKFNAQPAVSDGFKSTAYQELVSWRNDSIRAGCEVWLKLLRAHTDGFLSIQPLAQKLQTHLMDLHSSVDGLYEGVYLPTSENHQKPLRQVQLSVGRDRTPIYENLTSEIRFGRWFNETKPGRPLRAGELEAIQQLSASSGHIAMTPNTMHLLSGDETIGTCFPYDISSNKKMSRSMQELRTSHQTRSVGTNVHPKRYPPRGNPFNRIDLDSISKAINHPKNTRSPVRQSEARTMQHKPFIPLNLPQASDQTGPVHEHQTVHLPMISDTQPKLRERREPNTNLTSKPKVELGDGVPKGANVKAAVSRYQNMVSSRSVTDLPKGRSVKTTDTKLPLSNRERIKVIAKHLYESQDVDELSLKPKDVLIVLPWPNDSEVEEGWLYGERLADGARGLFPANFVQRV